MTSELSGYIKNRYGIAPDYPWSKFDDSAVFRHADSRKWFALVMKVRRDKFGGEKDEFVDVVNLRIEDAILHDLLVHEDGIFPAYHMNKKLWISVLLDGSVEFDRVCQLVDVSFEGTR